MKTVHDLLTKFDKSLLGDVVEETKVTEEEAESILAHIKNRRERQANAQSKPKMQEVINTIHEFYDEDDKDVPRELSASEAIYAFAGWLTCRDEEVTASAHHDAAIWAELVDEFCKANNFEEPKGSWHKKIQHPPENPQLKYTPEEIIRTLYSNQKKFMSA